MNLGEETAGLRAMAVLDRCVQVARAFSGFEFATIKIILALYSAGNHPDSISAEQAGRLTGLSPSVARRLLFLMAEQGLVRTNSAGEKISAVLTPVGQRAGAAIAAEFIQF